MQWNITAAMLQREICSNMNDLEGIMLSEISQTEKDKFCIISLTLLLLLSRFRHVRLCATPQTGPTRLPSPWDSPGKNTGVGCHFLLQCMKVKSESEIAQSCPTLSNPMDCSPPGSSIHGISRQEYWSGGPLPSLPQRPGNRI